MTLRRRKAIAWVALAAMLFGAVSPALAGVLFRHSPEILGRMLAVPPAAGREAARSAAINDDHYFCHDGGSGAGHEQTYRPTQHDGANHESHDNSEHAAHGTFCSFCLSGSSTVTLPVPAAEVWVVTETVVVLQPVANDQRPVALLAHTRHPRDPPATLS